MIGTLTTAPFLCAKLPLPPGINDSYAIGYVPVKGELKPRVVASASLKRFKEMAAWQLKDAKTSSMQYAVVENIRNSVQVKVYIPLHVEITYFFKTMWKQDVDGGDKAVIDVVFKHLRLNDNLVVDLHATKQVNRADPHVYVEVSVQEQGL